jgi:hypothetical protein
MSTDLTGLIPHGWAGGEAVTKWWRGKHLHLYRLRKNCAQCGKEMILDVTKAAIAGTAKNAGLHLTRCPECRAVSKGGGGTSRPTTRTEPTAGTNDELETLRTANVTMKEELEGLYMQNKELRQRLASYEPAERAPREVATWKGPPKPVQTYTLPPEPLTMVEATKNMQKFLAKNNAKSRENAKMPWEGG